MKTYLTYLFVLLGLHSMAQVQNQLYQGNKSYMDGDLDQAQTYYQKALSSDPSIYEGNFNLGNTNFRKQDFEAAITMYQQAAANSQDNIKKSNALHNLGNTYLQNQKIDEAIGAYKDALRANPAADETRYNLAYALKLKKQQEQNQDQNKDQEKNKDKQDQENQDQKNDQENQDKKEDQEDKQDKSDEKKQDEKDQEKKEEEQSQNQDSKPLELSPREAEQMLEAAKNEDQMLQMKMRKQQAKTKNIDKDW